MAEITVADLTAASVDGTGVFDVLMRATKAHLDQEWGSNRIRGTEYSTVYLGSLQSTMETALAFLVQREKIGLEAQLLAHQVELAAIQVQKANVELEILQASLNKVPAEIALIEAQTDNMVQKTANAVTENLVLQATKCKLDAEFDLLQTTNTKTTAETTLLSQKTVTERAQTEGTGVDDNSVVGRQKALYTAQTNGFARDAEQKVAKIMADTWNVRRTTDEGTVADATNMLSDAVIGRAINKMLNGVGA